MAVARAMGSGKRRISRGRGWDDGAEGWGGTLRRLGLAGLVAALGLLGGAGGAAAENIFVVVVCTGPSATGQATLTQGETDSGLLTCDSSDPTMRAVQYELGGFVRPEIMPIDAVLEIPGCGSTECGARGLITRNGGALRFFSRVDQMGVTVVVA